jgi:hypothetical protein
LIRKLYRWTGNFSSNAIWRQERFVLDESELAYPMVMYDACQYIWMFLDPELKSLGLIVVH